MRFVFLFILSGCLYTTSLFSQNTKNDSIHVYVFLSESCPICQSYTLKLKDLYSKYYAQNVVFTGIFPNQHITQTEIDSFQIVYQIPFTLLTDSGQVLVRKFNATITPEVFVEDASGKIIYSGRIDNTFYNIGKRRRIITSNDLEDALGSFLNGKSITNPKTQAIGCIISLSK